MHGRGPTIFNYIRLANQKSGITIHSLVETRPRTAGRSGAGPAHFHLLNKHIKKEAQDDDELFDQHNSNKRI